MPRPEVKSLDTGPEFEGRVGGASRVTALKSRPIKHSVTMSKPREVVDSPARRVAKETVAAARLAARANAKRKAKLQPAPAESPDKPKPLKRLYYCIGKGNNSIVLRKTFRSRKGWSPVDPTEAKMNFIWTMYKNKKMFEIQKKHQGSDQIFIVNHFPGNNALVTKKGLFHSLCSLHHTRGTDVSTSIPMTFHLKSGVENEEHDRFLECASKLDAKFDTRAPNAASSSKGGAGKEAGAKSEKGPVKKKLRGKNGKAVKTGKSRSGAYWIVKPASCTNRGVGIRVVPSAKEVFKIINKSCVPSESGAAKTDGKEKKKSGFKASKTKDWIVQKYIENPLLYQGRKFDIRCFVMLTGGDYSAEGPPTQHLKCYLYSTGYLRTSSTEWSLDEKKLKDPLMHLTNDGIQSKNPDQYGKHEKGNKVSYEKFQDYLTSINSSYAGAMESKILPQIKQLVIDSMEAVKNDIAGDTASCFELYGYDFMVDDDLNVCIIEVNSNPCLEDWCSPLLGSMISSMLDRMMHHAIDVPLNRLPEETKEEAPVEKTKFSRGFGEGSSSPAPPKRSYKRNDFECIWDGKEH